MAGSTLRRTPPAWMRAGGTAVGLVLGAVLVLAVSGCSSARSGASRAAETGPSRAATGAATDASSTDGLLPSGIDSASADPDACALLNLDDAAAALGTSELTTPEGTNNPPGLGNGATGNTCFLTRQDVGARLDVEEFIYPSADTAAAVYAQQGQPVTSSESVITLPTGLAEKTFAGQLVTDQTATLEAFLLDGAHELHVAVQANLPSVAAAPGPALDSGAFVTLVMSTARAWR